MVGREIYFLAVLWVNLNFPKRLVGVQGGLDLFQSQLIDKFVPYCDRL